MKQATLARNHFRRWRNRPRVRRVWDFVALVVERFRLHRCSQTASSLAFTTLLALVPALVIFLGIFSLSPYFAGFAKALKVFLFANLVPDAAGKITTVYMSQFISHAGKLTAAGTAVLSVSVLLLLLTLDQAFNAIWLVRKVRPLWRRVLRYVVGMIGGPLLIGILLGLATRWLGKAAGWGPVLSEISGGVSDLLPFVLTTLLLALLFRVIPKRYVPWKHALMGGLLTALVIELLEVGFALYVRYLGTFKLIYGAFASVPIFLLWIYCLWVVVLLGAIVTATLPYWGRPRALARPMVWDQYRLGLRVLAVLRGLGGASTKRAKGWQSLAARCDTGFDVLGATLDALHDAGWISETRTGWTLTEAGETVPDEVVLRLFLGSSVQEEFHDGIDLRRIE
ncbi:MAG: YihY family inner membrane protein [Betaproteobacteria bacterium]|nr:YihY family inner membrane protein [Betaproteobacteria bacterium]